jgi:regulatory protein
MLQYETFQQMASIRKPTKLSHEGLWKYALHTLSARAHSTAELRRKLLRRAQSSLDVNAIMTKLSDYGFADDTKFSESFASSRLANTGMGKFRVLRELRSKQVPARVAEKAVATAFQGTDEEELAEAFLRRKYRGKDLPAFLAEEKNLAAAFRKLRVGGFGSTAALSVLKRYSRKAGELADDPELEETDEAP